MGTTLGSAIVSRARDKANDETPDFRWSDAKALQYINDGQVAVVEVLPHAYTLTAIATAQPGTRQTLAGLNLLDGLTVVDVTRNFSADGLTPGRPITKRDRVWLDDGRPGWHSEVGAQAYHWMQDDRDPKAFFIYPGKSAGKLEVVYSAVPAGLASLDSEITLDDIYANALQFYLLFSMYSKDATHNRGQQLATTYYGLFAQSLGVRDRALTFTAQKGDERAAGA